MFIKKAKIANECANYVNKLESTLAAQPSFPDQALVHFLGQRVAFMSVYDFITKTEPKSDEIPLGDIIAFVSSEGKKSSSEAFDCSIDLSFLHNKRLALGKVMAYKTVEQILLSLKSELDKADSDLD